MDRSPFVVTRRGPLYVTFSQIARLLHGQQFFRRACRPFILCSREHITHQADDADAHHHLPPRQSLGARCPLLARRKHGRNFALITTPVYTLMIARRMSRPSQFRIQLITRSAKYCASCRAKRNIWPKTRQDSALRSERLCSTLPALKSKTRCRERRGHLFNRCRTHPRL